MHYLDNGIPLDAQYNDINYMDNFWDFTYDSMQYSDLPEFVDFLHSKNLSYVPIVDAGLALNQKYLVYQNFKANESLIRSAADNASDPFIGRVWPGDVVYPDFFNPNASKLWGKWLTQFHKSVEFDGVWTDMNEATNYCNGECYSW